MSLASLLSKALPVGVVILTLINQRLDTGSLRLTRDVPLGSSSLLIAWGVTYPGRNHWVSIDSVKSLGKRWCVNLLNEGHLIRRGVLSKPSCAETLCRRRGQRLTKRACRLRPWRLVLSLICHLDTSKRDRKLAKGQWGSGGWLLEILLCSLTNLPSENLLTLGLVGD